MVVTGGSGNATFKLEAGRVELGNGSDWFIGSDSEALVDVESVVFDVVVVIVVGNEGSSGNVGVVLEPSSVLLIVAVVEVCGWLVNETANIW